MTKPSHIPPGKSFSIKETADMLGIDRRVVQAALDSGKLRGTRTLAPITRITAEALADWLVASGRSEVRDFNDPAARSALREAIGENGGGR